MNQSFDNSFSKDIQKKFLTLMIFDPQWTMLSGLDVLKPEFFENLVLRNICLWIAEHYKKYKKQPEKVILTERARLTCDETTRAVQTYYLYTDVIEEIYTLSGEETLEYYKEQAIKFARKSAWNDAVRNAGNTGLEENNVEEALKKFRDVMSLGMETDLGMDFESVRVDFPKLLGEAYDKTNMIQTGVPGWDEALGGGFVKDNLHIIAAGPGGGKSRGMAFLAKQNAFRHKRVVFFTLELSETETMANIMSSVCGMSMYDLLKPDNQQEYYEKTTRFSETFGPNIIVKFYKPNTVTTDTLHNYIVKLQQYKSEQGIHDWKPDVIYCDYLDKLLPTQKAKGSIYEDNGGIADDLKNLAITYHCPVISGSQLGRYSWSLKNDEVVSMESIAESARKVHLCHSMTTVNFNPAEKELGKARLFLAKSRSGKPGRVIWTDYNLNINQITEVDPWDPKSVFESSGGDSSSFATNIRGAGK